jgi:hypothetical protein
MVIEASNAYAIQDGPVALKWCDILLYSNPNVMVPTVRFIPAQRRAKPEIRLCCD